MLHDGCGRFFIATDMNMDGVISISDVGLWVQYVFYLPAKIISWAIYNIEPLGRFFEMDCSTGSGIFSGLFSLFLWWFLLFLLPNQSNDSKR
jgi:hypothetical protein